MNLDRKTLMVALVAFVVGSYAAGGSGDDNTPEPLENRPVLRWIAKTAKTLLWVSLFVEPPPQPQHYVVHAKTDAEGNPTLNHGQGW
jgi:hypothetical protein